MKKIIRYGLTLIALGLLCQSCTDYDDYKKYTSGGEIIYPGKVDTIIAYNGKNRAVLKWVVSDPKIVSSLITWNGSADSLFVAISTKNEFGRDTVETTIPGMPEGNYTFYIQNRDESGNISLKTEVDGIVYGNLYIKMLLNRGIKASLLCLGVATIEWVEADAQETGVMVKYTDRSGQEKIQLVLSSEMETRLADYQPGTSLSYSTGFLPDSMAIDTLYTEWENIPEPLVVYRELDKSKFRECSLPGDVGTAWGWIMPYLWDDNLNEGSGFHTPDCDLPQHFTFDLGVMVQLSEITVWQRREQLYKSGNMKRFELWGATEPAADGSWNGWSRLGLFESVKPSGLPLGEISQEDTEYAQAGEKFTISADNLPVRYIRIRFIERWDPLAKASHLMEVAFKGDY